MTSTDAPWPDRAARRAEVGAKLARVRAYLQRSGHGAALIWRQDNFAWLTAGGDSHVLTGSDAGAIGLLVTHVRAVFIANRIEAARAVDEEVGELGLAERVVPWEEVAAPIVAARALVPNGRIAADVPGYDAALGRDFDALRFSLLPSEIERYRWLGRAATTAMVAASHAARPGMTEHRLGLLLSGPLVEQGIEARVVLVATDERVRRYRHPIPTDRRLERYAMLVVCAVRWGLVACVTRFVAFGPLDVDLRDRWLAVNQLGAHLILATRPGRRYSDIFAELTRRYAALGYPDEWRLHHQGGPTGYRGRDFVATFETPEPVVENQAVAWNPSIAGTKTEDTFLVTAAGHELLTRSGAWPYLTVEVDGQVLEMPGVLFP